MRYYQKTAPSLSKRLILKLSVLMLCLLLLPVFFSRNILAQDLSGTWQHIDDKTGSPKAIIETHKSSHNTFTEKLLKSPSQAIPH